jgi:G2/mitotic-specific cyclin 1/2
MREWALDRWSENTQVDLSEELCRVKAEIKLEREEEEAAQLMREDSKNLAADYAALQQLRARGSVA